MSERDWLFRLRDMKECAERAQRYTAAMTDMQFSASPVTIDAVLHNLIIMGEAANHIPEAFRDANTGIPWSLVRAMRNRLIHDYPGNDIAIIWRTVKEDIPPLEIALNDAIEAELSRRSRETT